MGKLHSQGVPFWKKLEVLADVGLLILDMTIGKAGRIELCGNWFELVLGQQGDESRSSRHPYFWDESRCTVQIMLDVIDLLSSATFCLKMQETLQKLVSYECFD